MGGTSSTKFYFNIGHTVGVMGRLLRGKVGITALKPVVRGVRVIRRLRREKYAPIGTISRLASSAALMVHSRKIRGDIVSSLMGEKVGFRSTAYPFIGGVRGVMSGAGPRGSIILVTKGGGRPRIYNVVNRYTDSYCAFGGRTRLSSLLPGVLGRGGGRIRVITRAAFSARR